MKAELAEEASNLRTRLGFHGAGWIRSMPIYLLVIGVFGVFLPWQKGRDFLDSVILGAYACLGVVFAAPAAAPEFESFLTIQQALARVVISVLYGELIAGVMLVLGIATVYVSRGGRIVVGPDLQSLAECAALGLTLSLRSEHGRRVAFHQDFTSRCQNRGPVGVPWACSPPSISAPGWLPAVALRGAGIALLASILLFRGAADNSGFREAKPNNAVNDVALPDKQGLILRVGLYILLAWMGFLLFPLCCRWAESW